MNEKKRIAYRKRTKLEPLTDQQEYLLVKCGFRLKFVRTLSKEHAEYLLQDMK